MTSTCSVSRGTETRSANSGGLVTTWADASTSVKCAVQGASSSEALRYARETGRATYDVMFPYGTDVRNGDRLTTFANHGVLGSSDVLAVIGNPIDESGRKTYVYVPCEQETGGANV
jgi:SPP1 family predicted phage head-tail adaptor